MLHRTLLRHCVPGGSSTGIHYDKLFLRGGGAFVPIGDVSSIGGGLHYLSDSVGLGQALEDDYDEARARLHARGQDQRVQSQHRSLCGSTCVSRR